MNIRITERNGMKIPILDSNTVLIQDVQSVLDLIATIGYDHDCHRIAIHKNAVVEDFFKLSSGIAGELAQKFVTYACQLAIIGDFSRYTSKPLHDFIYESNNGSHIFFVATEDEAVEKLAGD